MHAVPKKRRRKKQNILVRSFVVIAIDSVFVRPSTFVIVDFSIFFDAVRETNLKRISRKRESAKRICQLRQF